MFRVIGEACGGLLEVAEETMKKSYLGYEKIRIKGFEAGWMNPVIEILCEGEKVSLGAFSIRGLKGGVRGYRSPGVTIRMITRLYFEDFTTKRGVVIGPRVVEGMGNNEARVREKFAGLTRKDKTASIPTNNTVGHKAWRNQYLPL